MTGKSKGQIAREKLQAVMGDSCGFMPIDTPEAAATRAAARAARLAEGQGRIDPERQWPQAAGSNGAVYSVRGIAERSRTD